MQLGKELPARLGGYPWKLAYSTNEHGMSLQQMYRNMKAFNPNQEEVATIVLVQDVRGNVSLILSDDYFKNKIEFCFCSLMFKINLFNK